MKALVTGGAGFIGSHVVRALSKRNIEVCVMVLAGERTDNLDGLEIEKVEGNVLDVNAVRRAVAGCDRVYNLAAIYALWLPEPDLMRRVNVEGTTNVLGAAADAGVERVIYTSSIAVYGGQGLDRDATETSPPALAETGNLYVLTKIESHRVAMSFVDKGLDVRIVAPCGPIGPGDIGPTPTGRLVLSALNLPAVFILRTTNNVVDVRDVAEGHVLADEKGETGETYLLGNENLTHRQLAQRVFEAAGITRSVVPIPDGLAAIGGHVLQAWSQHVSRKPPLLTPSAMRTAKLGLRADCSRAFSKLGLPRRPVVESIRDALIWFAKNGYVTNARARENLLKMG